MADPVTAHRLPPLEGRHGGSFAARVEPAPAASRISLRAAPESVAALGAALGLDLPTQPKHSARSAERSALWLGPDEWLIIDESGADLMALAEASGVVHSAADISHRNAAAIVTGPKAALTLNAGCPLDLSSEVFPVGACARSLFGKSEVVIFRTQEDVFRVEFWRSFSDYVFGLLCESAEDAAH